MGLKDFTPIRGEPAGPIDFNGTGLGYIAIETTQRHAFGRRAISNYGEVFRYFRSLGDCLSGFGAANDAGVVNIAGVLPASVVAGARQVTVTIASGDGYAADGVIAADELVGAFLVAGHGEALVQNRMIIGNPAVATGGGTCRLTLNRPIGNALSTASFSEIMLNPFRYCKRGGHEYNAFMGVPAVNTPSGYCGWLQRRGPCWVCPGGGDATPGDTAGDRVAYFVGDGSVNFGTALSGGSLASHVPYQRAGYCLDQTASGTSAMPLLWLDLE